jgi:AGCS family alanine or glycine:cation symporter
MHEDIPEELQVGLRDHEPTKTQVKAEKQRLSEVKAERRRIRKDFRAAQRARKR